MTGRCSMALLMAPALLSAQLSYGFDLALHSRYDWRGITRHDGAVLQPDLFASFGKPTLRLTTGVWGNVELATPDAGTGIGLGRPWFGELNAWSELAWVVGPFDVAGGWTAYVFPRAASAVHVPGGLRDTRELYGRLEMLSLPVIVPHLAVWYDLHAVKGTYLEGGLGIRVPAWQQVLLPVGSFVLDAAAGYSVGQEVNPTAPTEAVYFARRGFTHLDVSAAVTGRYFRLGAMHVAVRAEFHVQRGWDPRVKIASATTTDQRVKTWLGLSLSVLAPQCRPARAICHR